MSVRADCPFCNARVVLEAIPDTPRTLCDRCGESFAAASWEATDDESVRFAATGSASKFWLSYLLGALAVLAAIAWFGYKLWGPKHKQPTEEVAKPLTVQPPKVLRGLLHLPATANVIVAVQPAAMIEFGEPAAKENPKAYLTSLGVPEQLLTVLEQGGVQPQDIEQIVAGVSFAGDRLVPGLTICVIFRNQLPEQAKLLKALQAERKPSGEAEIYTTKFMGLLAVPLTNRIWLFGLSDSDVTVKPTGNLDRFPGAIQEALTQRLYPASLAWVATDSRNWSDANPLLRTKETAKLAGKLARGRSLAASLHSDNGPKLQLLLELIDTKTTDELRAVLVARLPEAIVTVEGSRLTTTVPWSASDIGPRLRKMFDELQK